MTSAISTTNINPFFPTPGRDNDSQVFRTNFGAIKDGLNTAAAEINLLQAQKADLITQNFFSNTTPSVSTETGAVVIAGGVGIGKDLYVGGSLSINGGSAISTTTPFVSTGSEVLITGTYGTPVLTLATNIENNHLFKGKIAIAQTSTSTTTWLYVTTTGTTQTAAHFRASLATTVALKLETFHADSGNGIQYGLLQYAIANNPNVGGVKFYGNSLHYAGTSTFDESVIIAPQKNIKFADKTVWVGEIDQTNFDTEEISLGVGKFNLAGAYPGSYYGILAESPVLALVSTGTVFIGDYITGLARISGSSISPATDGALSLGESSLKFSAVWASSGTIQTSDIRLKDNIEPLTLGLDFIKELNPVRYDMKSGSVGHWGLISQQVKEVLERRGITNFAGLVEGDTEEKYLHLIYTEFIAPLIKSVKDLSDENDQLRKEISNIKAHLGL